MKTVTSNLSTSRKLLKLLHRAEALTITMSGRHLRQSEMKRDRTRALVRTLTRAVEVATHFSRRR